MSFHGYPKGFLDILWCLPLRISLTLWKGLQPLVIPCALHQCFTSNNFVLPLLLAHTYLNLLNFLRNHVKIKVCSTEMLMCVLRHLGPVSPKITNNLAFDSYVIFFIEIDHNKTDFCEMHPRWYYYQILVSNVHEDNFS